MFEAFGYLNSATLVISCRKDSKGMFALCLFVEQNIKSIFFLTLNACSSEVNYWGTKMLASERSL